MAGRDVIENKYKNCINKALNELPNYFDMYYRSLTNKTNGTKAKYLQKDLCFLNYISKTTNIDISNQNELSLIKPSMINDFLNNNINGGGSCKATYFYAIKNFFDYLYIDDIIDKNPCDKIKAPVDKKEHKITYLTDKEIIQLMDNIENGIGSEEAKKIQSEWKIRNKVIISLALSTGLRCSSIVSLNTEDINFLDSTIRIYEKGNKERYIKISPSLESILSDWLDDRFDKLNELNLLQDENALFINRRGSRMGSQGIYKLIDTFTSNIPKHITPHKLRSTYATHALKKTHDIYLVANQLGHSNIRNTARYAAIDEEMAEKAATAMDDILF